MISFYQPVVGKKDEPRQFWWAKNQKRSKKKFQWSALREEKRYVGWSALLSTQLPRALRQFGLSNDLAGRRILRVKDGSFVSILASVVSLTMGNHLLNYNHLDSGTDPKKKGGGGGEGRTYRPRSTFSLPWINKESGKQPNHYHIGDLFIQSHYDADCISRAAFERRLAAIMADCRGADTMLIVVVIVLSVVLLHNTVTRMVI